MFAFSRAWLMSLLLLWTFTAAHAQEQLICCGGAEVFVIPLTKQGTSAIADRSWRWQAADSSEIPAALRAQFRTTDDCKPYSNDRLLITSSSGGVALLNRKDKQCLFYTSVKNAHSACLLPDERIAVASSTGGDELLIFDLGKSGETVSPLAKLKFLGAHGVYWDKARARLWSLGTEELLLVKLQQQENKLELSIEERWKLPTAGGHDLSPSRDERYLFVTTEHGVYRFDTKEKRFEPFKPLADFVDIKSLDEHPTSGAIVYHQADHANKTWWSDTIRLLEPARSIQLPKERLYKVRWDALRP